MDAAPAARPPVDHWMLPGELVRAAGTGVPDGRTPRDWAVDVVFFAVAVLVGIVMFRTTVLDDVYGLPMWLRVVDPVAGAVACLALWWRRRFPVALGLLAAAAAAVSNSATGAVLVLLFSLALHRGWTPALPLVAALATLLGVPYLALYVVDHDTDPYSPYVVITLLFLLVMTAGLAVRARRRLVLVLRARADETRREYENRLQDSRRDERARIAREMHDTLAHRISLLSVHAGALEYRTEQAEAGTAPPLTAAEVHDAVGVMRGNATRALEELREVLHVLRPPGAGGPDADPPQPTADLLPGLLADARRSGQQVDATLRGDLDGLRPRLQHTVYRLVQEGLTNARKHAPGAAVEVRVTAEPGREVEVRVVNPVAVGVTSDEIPGARTGLVGLAERVGLHGGELGHDVTEGRFRLVARLPWGP
ncbi:sensor histidine kinase [Pseudonocardia hydrocarbonoxydans]|uniref:histidine kinase n=1 Tax=Pseudonocardia hydrocarbonoxydans TaxID=76726 RepID=A0A4Y3WKI7_9PSEU|nr:histidine kinase [Pseudonocardia hydrocarbonoxydans]GEC19285.1 two-component sensor histidine kinase [Pseudonocardia hydrocarbonoxydans]